MNLFQRKKGGPWYVRFRHPVTGRDTWRSTRTSDRKTAELLGKAIEVKLARQEFGIEPKDARRHIPLSQFAKIYLKYSRTNKAHNTAEVDRFALDALLEILGDKLITEIRPTDLEHFKTERLKTISPRTLNTQIGQIKAAFSKAVEWGYLTENPTKGVSSLRLPKSPPKYLSEEDIAKLLALDVASRIQDREFGKVIRFFLLTGLRRSELIHLEWTDIDSKNKLLHVRNKEGFRTKTLGERSIPISPALKKLIVEIGPKSKGYIFPSPNGGPYYEGAWSNKFKRRVRRAKINPSFTLHTLRHTFATHLREKGVGLDVLAELLGHSHIEMTRVYGHITPSTLQNATSLLEW